MKRITISILKADINRLNKAEKNVLEAYKRLIKDVRRATPEQIKTLQEWVKVEYPTSWGKKLSALIGGAKKYSANLADKEIEGAATVTALMQLVRSAKHGPASAADANTVTKATTGGGAIKTKKAAPKISPEKEFKGDSTGTNAPLNDYQKAQTNIKDKSIGGLIKSIRQSMEAIDAGLAPTASKETLLEVASLLKLAEIKLKGAK